MAKRNRAIKLFAVALLAGGTAQADPDATVTPRVHASGRPACGNVMGKGEKREPGECSDLDAALAAARYLRDLLAPFQPVPQPVVTSGVTPARGTLERSLRTLLGISVSEPIPARAPRQLETGRPACGNVASRAPRTGCDDR